MQNLSKITQEGKQTHLSVDAPASFDRSSPISALSAATFPLRYPLSPADSASLLFRAATSPVEAAKRALISSRSELSLLSSAATRARSCWAASRAAVSSAHSRLDWASWTCQKGTESVQRRPKASKRRSEMFEKKAKIRSWKRKDRGVRVSS